jgi:putative transposase
LQCESTAGKKGDLGEEEDTGSNPTDRGKTGCKRHVLTDAKGIPLAVVLSGANRHDSKKLEVLLKAVMTQRPSDAEREAGFVEALCLDKGYDSKACRASVFELNYEGHIKARGVEKVVLDDVVVYPARRWVVEAAHSWMNRFRRLLVRWEKKSEHYLGFVALACCLIIWRKIAPLSG